MKLDLLDVAKLVDFSFTGTGIIQGNKVFHIIEEIIGDIMIEDLPISFTATATDLIKQKRGLDSKREAYRRHQSFNCHSYNFYTKKISERYLIDGVY